MSRAALEAAAAALARGDAMAALGAATGIDGPRAAAVRGVALAQLGDREAARRLLARAAEELGAEGDGLGRARALAALAEIDAARREVGPASDALVEARDALRGAGDRGNAAWVGLVLARLLLLGGDVTRGGSALDAAEEDATGAADAVRAGIALARAELAARDLAAGVAAGRAAEARRLAERAGNDLLLAEVARFEEALFHPCSQARLDGVVRGANLADVEALVGRAREEAGFVLVDGLRRRVIARGQMVDLSRRPVLFAIARALAEAAPSPIAAADLARVVFETRVDDASVRARLRVELGRLRGLLCGAGDVASERGAVRWTPPPDGRLALLVPLGDGPTASIAAILDDGEAWSAAAVANALGKSPRTVQRALAELVHSNAVVARGRGPARRYAAASAAERIASRMLLLGILHRR